MRSTRRGHRFGSRIRRWSGPTAEALLRRGVAVGGYRLEAYIALDDYAAAMRYGPGGADDGRASGIVSMQEIVALHGLVARRTSPRPGLLREVTLPAFPGGMVPAPGLAHSAKPSPRSSNGSVPGAGGRVADRVGRPTRMRATNASIPSMRATAAPGARLRICS